MAAFFSGRLRTRFYADVRQFGDNPDATRQIAAGYICLAGALGWIVSFFIVISVKPSNVEAHVLAIANMIGCAHGFLQIRRRRDPRAAMDWLLPLHFATIAVISFRHSGVVAPVVFCLPVLVGVTCLYARERMRTPALVLAAAVIGFCILTATGAIGIASSYSTNTLVLMTFISMSLACIALGGTAWIANIARDYSVHQLRTANELIVANASRSRIALEAARVGLWDVPNTSLRKFHVSESFPAVTGYSAEEFDKVFNLTGDFVHPDDLGQLREAFAQARKRMSRLRIDFRLKTKSRGYRWFSARARYSLNANGSVRISGSLQDINFIKAAEDALRAGRDSAREANKAKSDFIAVMSHEVRTPLNAILGSVEVLKRRGHDGETSELIGLIDDAGQGLLTIVNDLLDVSKIEAGKLEIAQSPIDVNDLVKRTVDFWRPQAGSKGLVLKFECDTDKAGALLIDAGRVRQIVGNLISNAIKFTDAGTVTAILSMHEAGNDRVEIGLSVIDTGPGVPNALAETIFAPFEQGPSNASRGGTGLGLFISRRLARLMGGDLTLEPSRPNGAHFRLSLVVDRPNTAAAQNSPTEDEPAWHGKRVLCVDDNENNRRIAELLLGSFGAEVTTCASGDEALDVCTQRKFDIVLMDIVMPEMDGMETVRRLRRDEASLNRQTPAIALTAKLAPDDIAAYAAAGLVGVAGKPINVRELARAMAPYMTAANMPPN